MTKSELYDRLKDLPSEEDYKYENALLEIAMDKIRAESGKTPDHNAEEDFFRDVDGLINMKNGADLSDEEEKVAFAAFVIRVSFLRRKQNYTLEMDFLNRYQYRFREHPLFDHFYVMGLIDTDLISSAKRILSMAEKNAEKFPRNAGIQHVLAISVAEIFEKTEFIPGDQPDAEWLDKGFAAAERVLRIRDDYAKFHCTKGRLLALKGQYDGALAEIQIAIDKENSENSDYALRIDSYRTYAQYIRTKQRADDLEERVNKEIADAQKLIAEMKADQEEFRSKTRQALNKNTEFLGLFAGIVSFTIGGLDIAGVVGSKSFMGAAAVIIVLMGALLGVFVGFDFILHAGEKRSFRADIFVGLFALLATVIGVVLCS